MVVEELGRKGDKERPTAGTVVLDGGLWEARWELINGSSMAVSQVE